MTSARSALFATVAEPCREISEKRGLRLAINRPGDAQRGSWKGPWPFADKFVVKGQKRGMKFEIGKNTKM